MLDFTARIDGDANSKSTEKSVERSANPPNSLDHVERTMAMEYQQGNKKGEKASFKAFGVYSQVNSLIMTSLRKLR